MNAHACLIESSKTTISLSAILECTAQAGPFAYTLHTKTLSYSECAGHAWLKAHAHTRTYSLDRKHAHTHTHTNTHTGSYFAILHCTGRPVWIYTYTHIHTHMHSTFCFWCWKYAQAAVFDIQVGMCDTCHIPTTIQLGSTRRKKVPWHFVRYMRIILPSWCLIA